MIAFAKHLTAAQEQKSREQPITLGPKQGQQKQDSVQPLS